MGHSQSYNLQNHDINEKAPVRGVRRVSKEPPENTQFSAESNSEPHDVREIQLRERIRQEQLRDRELELESMRIRRNESREPIIDAYRQSQPPIYKEFNHYDSLKQHSPVDPVTYFNLRPYTEVNDGRQLPIPTSPTDFYDQVPVEPTIRYDQVPVEPTLRTTRREAPVKQTINSVDYPRRTSLYSGRLSPLQRQEEVGQHSMPSYSPPTSPSTPIVDTPTQVSEIHAQKRMVVGIDEPKDNVTYVTVATSPIACPDEPLYRHADVKKHPVYVSPSQTNYEVGPRRDSQTHYSRRQPDKAANISEPSQRCNVENCTHVEITEMESPILEGRTSKDTNKYKESRITIPVQGNDLDNVVELVHDNEDSGTSKSNRCFEEKLFYDPYMPTLSLNRRPIASFYDKIH